MFIPLVQLFLSPLVSLSLLRSLFRFYLLSSFLSPFFSFSLPFIEPVNVTFHCGAKERVKWRLSKRASLSFGGAAGGRPVSSVGGLRRGAFWAGGRV